VTKRWFTHLFLFIPKVLKGCYPLSIGDDWFTKSMIISTLSRTEKIKPQQGTTNSQVDNLFAVVLSELLAKQEFQSSPQPVQNSPLSDMLMGNMMLNGNTPTIDMINTKNNGDTLGFQPINTDKLNQVLDGKLKGLGDVFVKAGQTYNIDPALLTAVAQHESGNGKSQAANIKNNIAGMMGPNGLKSYETVEESIMDMARNLSSNYLGKGLTSISSIGAKYAPVGAQNDPTGLNNYWVTGVTKNFDKLKNQLV
jgi:beta-N-acetylglucosaminidase